LQTKQHRLDTGSYFPSGSHSANKLFYAQEM